MSSITDTINLYNQDYHIYSRRWYVVVSINGSDSASKRFCFVFLGEKITPTPTITTKQIPDVFKYITPQRIIHQLPIINRKFVLHWRFWVCNQLTPSIIFVLIMCVLIWHPIFIRATPGRYDQYRIIYHCSWKMH